MGLLLPVLFAAVDVVAEGLRQRERKVAAGHAGMVIKTYARIYDERLSRDDPQKGS